MAIVNIPNKNRKDSFFYMGQAISEDQKTDIETKTLPLLVWVVLISTAFALLGGEGVLGYRVSGLAWFVPLIFSIFAIIQNPGKASFPSKIWLPWILLLVIYLVSSEYHSLQRTAQLICPIVVGMAVSACDIEPSQVKSFIARCKPFSIALVLIALWNTGTLLTGIIPSVTALSPQAMTAILFCCFFAASYTIGNRKDLYWWGMMAAVPIFAVTRTAMAVAALTLPLTFAPLKLHKRVLFLVIALVMAIALFQTERIQKKMFRSDRGTLEDIQSQNLDDSGRKFMWALMKIRIKQKLWFGHGTGAGGDFIFKVTGGLRFPHNDWLLTLHDQGILGTAVFALSMIAALLHALFRTKTATPEARLLFFTGASAFVSMALMMITDNIMVYASYFGNLHFAILGMAYAAEKNERNKADMPVSDQAVKLLSD